MRLSTAFGVLAQTALLSSAAALWPFEDTQAKNVVSPAKNTLMKRSGMDGRRLVEQVKTKGARMRQHQKQQQQQQGRRKQQEMVRRLRNRRNSRVLRNKPGITDLLRMEKKCSIDIGILDCGIGEYCEMGVCVRQDGKPQLLQNPTNAAETFCDPSSIYFEDLGDNGFFNCDCSQVDLTTGTGILTCVTPNTYCLDQVNQNYCADISLELDFMNGGLYYTYEYCYNVVTPYAQFYCINADSYYNSCSIEIDGQLCDTCVPAPEGTCSNDYEPIFSDFDCTNILSVPTYAGNKCYGGYASGLLQRASQEVYEQYNPFLLLCGLFGDDDDTVDMRRKLEQPDDDDDGILENFVCDCSGVDPTTYLGSISCSYDQYCYGPYCLGFQFEANFPAMGEYNYELCYEFTAPYEQSYCVYRSSLDPYGCRMSIDDMQCNDCLIGDLTICPVADEVGTFDCTNIGFNAGTSCLGEYATPLLQDLSDFDETLIVVTPDTLENLVMQLFGIDDLSEMDLEIWIEATETFIEEYFINNPAFGVSNINVEILVVDVIEDDARFLARKLQGDFVTIVYDQDMNYMQSTDSRLTPEQIAALPFASPASRSDYVQLLQDVGLDDVIGSSEVMDGLEDDRNEKKRAKRGKKSGKRGKSDKSSKKKPKSDKYSKKTKLESKKHGKRT